MEKELNKCIPEEIQKQIWECGAEEKIYDSVYRVSKRGMIDKEAFKSTYEEILAGQLPNDENKYPKNKIGTYSTSVYTDIAPCKKFINLLKRSVRLRKEYPFPIIIKGKTLHGLTQKTCEREENYPDEFHVDWWIYDGMIEYAKEEYKVVEEGYV